LIELCVLANRGALRFGETASAVRAALGPRSVITVVAHDRIGAMIANHLRRAALGCGRGGSLDAAGFTARARQRGSNVARRFLPRSSFEVSDLAIAFFGTSYQMLAEVGADVHAKLPAANVMAVGVFFAQLDCLADLGRAGRRGQGYRCNEPAGHGEDEGRAHLKILLRLFFLPRSALTLPTRFDQILTMVLNLRPG